MMSNCNTVQVGLTFPHMSGLSLLSELSTYSTLSPFPNEPLCVSECNFLVYWFKSEHCRRTRCEHSHHKYQLQETTQIRLDWITEPFPEAYDSGLRAALSAKLPVCKSYLVTVSTLSVTVGPAEHPTFGDLSYWRRILFCVNHFPISQYQCRLHRDRGTR